MRLAIGILAAVLAFPAALAHASPTGQPSGTAPVLQANIDDVLTKLGVTLEERPIRSEDGLCRDFRQKGYQSSDLCREDARKYISKVFASYIPAFKEVAERKAAEVAKARRADIADLMPFSLSDDELTRIAGPEGNGFVSGPSVRQRFKEMHQRTVEPYLSPVVARVEQRIIQEFEDAGLTEESLEGARSQCIPVRFQQCFANCPKRPLDNMNQKAWHKLKQTCEAKDSEVPVKRCKAAAEKADPDGAFDHRRLAVHGRKGGVETFNYPNLVCSAAMDGIQIRLREKGWFSKTRWLEFGVVGEDDTLATATLETITNSDGVKLELIKAIEGSVAPFSGPEDMVPCLYNRATGQEMEAVKSAVIGGILAGLGDEEAGGSIFDAFAKALKVDKCRADIRKLAGQS